MAKPNNDSFPFALKALNRIGAGLSSLGLNLPAIDAEKAKAAAIKKTGLSDFGDYFNQEGLQRVVHAYNTESHLSTLGRLTAKNMLEDNLVNLLRVEDTIKQRPEIAEAAIKKPIFILGLPRTGSTILQELLSLDNNHRFVLSWEASEPYPPATQDTVKTDPRIAQVNKQLEMTEVLMPNLKAIHFSDAELPQECAIFMAWSFFFDHFSTMAECPHYRDWYLKADAVQGYEWHKRVLQYYQSNYSKPRWVLKAPQHIRFLETIFQVYPDACVIQTHREPYKTMPSLASLIYTTRSALTTDIDPHHVGQTELAVWSYLIQCGVDARENLNKEDQIFDFYFEDTIKDPLPSIERLYEQFNLELSAETAKVMREHMANKPMGKHGKHSYSLEQFGMSRQMVDDAFVDYRKKFNM